MAESSYLMAKRENPNPTHSRRPKPPKSRLTATKTPIHAQKFEQAFGSEKPFFDTKKPFAKGELSRRRAPAVPPARFRSIPSSLRRSVASPWSLSSRAGSPHSAHDSLSRRRSAVGLVFVRKRLVSDWPRVRAAAPQVEDVPHLASFLSLQRQPPILMLMCHIDQVIRGLLRSPSLLLGFGLIGPQPASFSNDPLAQLYCKLYMYKRLHGAAFHVGWRPRVARLQVQTMPSPPPAQRPFVPPSRCDSGRCSCKSCGPHQIRSRTEANK